MASLSSRSADAPQSTPDGPLADGVWREMADELAELATLARAGLSASEFYAELLRRVTTALALPAGAVWTPRQGGRFKQVCVTAGAERPADDQLRREHERLLAVVAAQPGVRVFAPHATQAGGPTNHSDTPLVVGPVRPPQGGQAPPAALIELTLPAGLSPAACQGVQDYLQAVSEVAADFHLVGELARLNERVNDQQRLQALGERVHRSAALPSVAATIANEARDAIGCDRVSVLAARRSGCRVLAISGVDRPNRRSRSVRGLEEIAAICRRLGDPLYLADDTEDALPQAAEALHRYADESHSRLLAAVPMRTAGQEDEPGAVVGVLVAENFDGRPEALARDRVAEAADICAPALRNALDLDAIPLAQVQRGLSGLAHPGAIGKLLLILATVAAGVAALILTPAQLRIEARGELQPVEQSNLFAPRDAIVDALVVRHGQQVQKGDVLATLRDPELDLEIERVEGERETTRRQLDAVRATRTSLDTRNATAADAYRLSAEQQQLRQRLAALDAERDLLERQSDSLTLRSPQAGMVVTWQIEQTLLGRPVERGQKLLAVAETDRQWRIELEVPDDRIGRLLRAQREGDDPVRVEYRLGSQESGFATGHVTRVAQRADEPPPDAAPGSARTVVVYVMPDTPLGADARRDARPGASVRARVLCGEYSLGYVWLHDLIDAARVWWEF